MPLTETEKRRYERHLNLAELGDAGQLRLKDSRVLVVGAGGLGCPVLSYLAAAGVGMIGVIDGDAIELSNLQRQVLYTEAMIGQNKAECAAKRIHALNSSITVRAYPHKLDALNALKLIHDYDVVVDGSDNFATRYLVNDACVLAERPLVAASIHAYEGQLSVFNAYITDTAQEPGPSYRCLYEHPPSPEIAPTCGEAGVLGVLTGIVGSMQANEVIKLVTGVGESLSGKLLVFDCRTLNFRYLVLRRNSARVEQVLKHGLLSDAEYSELGACNSIPESRSEISVQDLSNFMAQGREFQLVDVREPAEHTQERIGNELLVPLAEVSARVSEIRDDVPVIIYCAAGTRSARAVTILSEHGLTNALSLAGGFAAWRDTTR